MQEGSTDRSPRQLALAFKAYAGLAPIALGRKGAALALWYLARAVDSSGAGVVELETLRESALRIWSRAKFYKAMRQAAQLGLLRKEIRYRDGARVVFIIGLLRTVELFSVTSLGTAPIVLRLSALRTAGTFRAASFAAFQAGRPHASQRPMSRQTICELVGITRQTQARYERRHNVQRDGQVEAQRNFAVTGLGADSLTYARDHIHPGCYLYGAQVVRPLPNTYHPTLKRAGRRTVRRINRRLRSDLVRNTGAGQRASGVERRLFYGEGEGKAYMRRRDRMSAQESETAVLLRYDRRAHDGAGVWRYG